MILRTDEFPIWEEQPLKTTPTRFTGIKDRHFVRPFHSCPLFPCLYVSYSLRPDRDFMISRTIYILYIPSYFTHWDWQAWFELLATKWLKKINRKSIPRARWLTLSSSWQTQSQLNDEVNDWPDPETKRNGGEVKFARWNFTASTFFTTPRSRLRQFYGRLFAPNMDSKIPLTFAKCWPCVSWALSAMWFIPGSMNLHLMNRRKDS